MDETPYFSDGRTKTFSIPRTKISNQYLAGKPTWISTAAGYAELGERHHPARGRPLDLRLSSEEKSDRDRLSEMIEKGSAIGGVC
jgi:hypothetical protein